MYVIGIPTYNEEDNISNLVKQIDKYSRELDLDIVIINSDSFSNDKTVEKFSSTQTYYKKISLVNDKKGKGLNIRNILEYSSKIANCKGCILIDGDIKSLSKKWLDEYTSTLDNHYDFIIPNYLRNFREGNTTNHFIFPFVRMFLNQSIPKQLIGGDFGLSKKYIDFLVSHGGWHRYTEGYGIDIFLSLTAIFNSFAITEVDIHKKLHNPSFHKIENMFLEVASSTFETIRPYKNKKILLRKAINGCSYEQEHFLDTNSDIDYDYLKQLKRRYTALLLKNNVPLNTNYDDDLWINYLKLILHKIDYVDSEKISRTIQPYFMIHVINYLETVFNKKEADEYFQQFYDKIFCKTID